MEEVESSDLLIYPNNWEGEVGGGVSFEFPELPGLGNGST